MVRPSLEALSKYLMIKRCAEFSLVREGSCHEELGKTLAGLPFWSHLTWMSRHWNPIVEPSNETERQWKISKTSKS
jgi:hypothetical protein